MKIRVHTAFPADLDLGDVRPGEYEVSKIMARGEAKNSKPEEAVFIDGLNVSMAKISNVVLMRKAEII
jgi:hypothetical protein